MTLAALVALALTGCAGLRTVHQEDLDAWKGVPVGALDTHSLFATLPMTKNVSPEGIEVRNYVNSPGAACIGTAAGTATLANCARIACNSTFYIREGRVVEMAVSGRCYTDATVRPEKRYVDLLKR